MMEQLEMPNISHHIVGERSENDNDELVDIASSTSQSEACVAELEEKLAQLLSDRQRLLDNQSHVEECLHEADEEVEQKTEQIKDMQQRLMRQQEKLRKEQERANDMEQRYSQLSADFARLSRELEARKAQMRRESLSSTPPSRPPMSPLRHALSKDNLAISPLPFAQEVVVELPVSEPTSKSNSDIEVVASGGLATSSIEVTVEEPSCLASTEDLVALQSLQDRLDEREHELRLAYQQMAKAGLRVRSRSGSDSSSPMRPENLETIQTCQWCHDIFLVGDEVECPDAPAHHAKKFRQTASGGLFPCCSGGRDSVGCIKGQHSAVGPCDLSDLQEHEEAAPVPAMSASLLSDDSWYDASSVPITEAVIRAELKHGPISLKALTARLISETWTKPEKIEAQTTLRTTLFSMEDSNELLVNIVDESLMLFLQSK